MKIFKVVLLVSSVLILSGSAFAQENPAGKTFSGDNKSRTKEMATKKALTEANKSAETACKNYCESLGKKLLSVIYDGEPSIVYQYFPTKHTKCNATLKVKECICQERTISDDESYIEGEPQVESCDPLLLKL